MKKWLLIVGTFSVFCFLGTSRIFAGEVTAEAVSTSAAEVVQDLTVPEVRVERILGLLEAQRTESFLPFNFLKIPIRSAVERGVSINTVVLLLLFPLVASLVAFSRQVLGLNGFGMITPSLLAIAFLSTGGWLGILMLVFVVGTASFFKVLIKKVKVPYLPKLAILLWMVLIGVLILMLSGNSGFLGKLSSIGIFPIILFVSVAETFIEAQITRNFGSSLVMLLETVILALVGYKIMSSHFVQSLALLNPELWLIFILVINLLIARYKGLRFLEVWRFRKIILR